MPKKDKPLAWSDDVTKKIAERKLMDCLTRLGYDIEIKVRPAAEPVGHLMLAFA